MKVCFLTVLDVRSTKSTGVGRFDFFWGLTPWLVHGGLLVVSSYGHFPVQAHPWCAFAQIFSSCRITSQMGLGPTLMALFQLNYLFMGLISKYSKFRDTRSSGSIYELGGAHNSSHNTHLDNNQRIRPFSQEFCMVLPYTVQQRTPSAFTKDKSNAYSASSYFGFYL